MQRHRGSALLEILMGLSVGLVVVAGASSLAASQWAHYRNAREMTQTLQTLRRVSDAIARDLRRSGIWHLAAHADASQRNPYAGLQWSGSSTTSAATAVSFSAAHPKRSDDNLVTDDERLGFRLRQGVVETQIGLGNWQALHDPAAVRFVQMTLTPTVVVQPLPCESTSSPDPPRLLKHLVHIELQAHPSARPAAAQQWATWVRVRQDTRVGTCTAS